MSNREQTETLLDSLEAEGMQITEPDLAPFAEATASVLTQNAHIYGDLYDEMEEWREKH